MQQHKMVFPTMDTARTIMQTIPKQAIVTNFKGAIMKKILTILAIAGFIIASASNAFSMKGKGHGHHGEYGGMHMMNHSQILTKDEKNAIQKERKTFMESTRELRKEIFNVGMDLETEINKTDVNSAKVKEIRQKLYGLNQDLRKKHINHRKKLNKIVPGFSQMKMGKHHKLRGHGECPMSME